MLFHNKILYQIIKTFSTSTKKSRASITWRTQITQTQLVQQISSILLQRHNWTSILQNLNLASKLTPSLFLQVLKKTQQNPKVSLNFFNWIKTNLQLKPDLKSQCLIIQLVLASGQRQPIKPILDSLIQTHTAKMLTHSLIQACKGRDSQSDALSIVLHRYSHKGLFMDGLEVYKMMRAYGFVPSISACNALLDAMYRQNEIRLGWCSYGTMIRDGILPNKFTWSLVAQILCVSGKFEIILRLLNSGVYNSVIYNLVIDFYSKIGNFKAAFDRLNEMYDSKKLTPGFSAYSSILDGACKYNNVEVIDRIMGLMIQKELLTKCVASGNDSVIQKLCDSGKTHAAEMIFKRACDEKLGLQDETYGYMFRALSKEGRLKEAIQIYHLISERGITVKDSCYYAFVNVLCKEDLCEETCKLLRDLVRRGYCPCAMELSKYVTFQCSKCRWREVEELLNAVLEQGLLLDLFCCCSLMEHYCSSGQIDKAIELHGKMEQLKASLDVSTYNVLLDGLFKDGRIEEAIGIFDYMKGIDAVSSLSFAIMITGLCRIKEQRKAMKIHDEMLKMGLKPDEAAYKQLICGFQ